MKKESSAVAVVVLFFGLALAPSINANITKQILEDDFFELEVEFCGLGNKHTVKLTQHEYEEVELLFDEIQAKLGGIETREEAKLIFRDAIIELDKYGLLGELNTIQVQRLVTGISRSQLLINVLEKSNNQNHGTLDLNTNAYCLIAGRTTETHFIGLLLKIAWSIYLMVPQFLWHAYYNGIITPLLTLSIYQPFFIGTEIIIRNGMGWVWTLGLFGIQSWNGIIVGTEPSSEPNTAVSRFRGIKILLDSDSSNNFYFGFAMAASMQEVE